MMNFVSNDNTREETESLGKELSTESLTNDQNKFIHLDPIPDFKDRSEIKPWLQKIFYPQGIEIVIERSDSIKVVFKCKAAKRGKNTRASESPHEPFNVPNEPEVKGKKKKKRSVSRFNTCPFRIRATYSLKRKKWSIVVVNNCHSHPLKFNPDSEEYKKFKQKLRQDDDWEAIKKFDELEYRTRSNLPIESSLIKCDCGLTEEIASFNIVLPSTKHSSASSSSSTLVKKPKSTSKLREQRKEAFYKMPTHQERIQHMTHVQSPSISGFIDDPTVNPLFMPPTAADKALTDLNEIDFTNMFDKLHQPHSEPAPTGQPRLQHRHSGTEGALNVFSPTTISSFRYYSPSDDLLQSPAQQAHVASSTHNSTHNAVDFAMKPFTDFPCADPFTPPVCELNARSSLAGDGEPLTAELEDLKTMNGELHMLGDHYSDLFNLQQQAHRPEQPFQTGSPWNLHTSPNCTPSGRSTTVDHGHANEAEDVTDKSLWELNFGSP